MADSSTPQGIPKQRKISDGIPMESVQRLAKLPVVESSLNMATDVYSRVKEASPMLNWTLTTAESTVSRAVEHALPVAERLEKPLRRVDTLLCSSLDYVEAKVPAVKLPPHEMPAALTTMVLAMLNHTRLMMWPPKEPDVPFISVPSEIEDTPLTPLPVTPQKKVWPCPPPPPPTPINPIKMPACPPEPQQETDMLLEEPIIGLRFLEECAETTQHLDL